MGRLYNSYLGFYIINISVLFRGFRGQNYWVFTPHASRLTPHASPIHRRHDMNEHIIAGGGIPPDATLIFAIELQEISA